MVLIAGTRKAGSGVEWPVLRGQIKKGTQGLLQQAMEDIGETSRLDIKQKTEGPDHSRSKPWKAKRPYGPSAKPIGGLKPTHVVARRIYRKKQENPHTGIDEDKNSNSSSKAGVWRQRQSSSSDWAISSPLLSWKLIASQHGPKTWGKYQKIAKGRRKAVISFL